MFSYMNCSSDCGLLFPSGHHHSKLFGNISKTPPSFEIKFARVGFIELYTWIGLKQFQELKVNFVCHSSNCIKINLLRMNSTLQVNSGYWNKQNISSMVSISEYFMICQWFQRALTHMYTHTHKYTDNTDYL